MKILLTQFLSQVNLFGLYLQNNKWKNNFL